MNSFLQRFIAILILVISLPLWPLLYLGIKTSPGPFIFRQRRVGKNKKPFTIYKIRTMVENAEYLKTKYLKLNEADGPVFKIRDDPRYTKVGKLISRFAIDEIPQFVNVIKGDMGLVGPRPLPIDEAAKIPERYKLRFSVLPGMTSLWVVKGGHTLSFEEWMEFDLNYVKIRSAKTDLTILLKTFSLLMSILTSTLVHEKRLD